MSKLYFWILAFLHHVVKTLTKIYWLLLFWLILLTIFLNTYFVHVPWLNTTNWTHDSASLLSFLTKSRKGHLFVLEAYLLCLWFLIVAVVGRAAGAVEVYGRRLCFDWSFDLKVCAKFTRQLICPSVMSTGPWNRYLLVVQTMMSRTLCIIFI